MNGHYAITYGSVVAFTKTGDIEPQTAPSGGNDSDQTIHHPKLGQVDTAGNRFAAILEASKRLHGLQTGQRFAVDMRRRAHYARSMPPLIDKDDDPLLFARGGW